MKIGSNTASSSNAVVKPLVDMDKEKRNNRLRIIYLRRLHSLTEAQAQIMASLI